MSAMLPFLPAIGSSVAAVGTIAAGQNAAAAANRNAAMMRQEADTTRQQGGARAEAQMREAREILGRQRAAIGQAGIGWEGSAQDIMLESATAAELDKMNILYETELKARGLLGQADITKWEGKVAKRASYVQAAGTLLNAGAQYGKAAGKIPG